MNIHKVSEGRGLNVCGGKREWERERERKRAWSAFLHECLGVFALWRSTCKKASITQAGKEPESRRSDISQKQAFWTTGSAWRSLGLFNGPRTPLVHFFYCYGRTKPTGIDFFETVLTVPPHLIAFGGFLVVFVALQSLFWFSVAFCKWLAF